MVGFKWGVDRNALGMVDTGEARLRVIDVKAPVKNKSKFWPGANTSNSCLTFVQYDLGCQSN